MLARRTIRFCPETRPKAPRRVKASKRTSDSIVGTMPIAGATLANVVGRRAVGGAAFRGEGLSRYEGPNAGGIIRRKLSQFGKQ